jgi:uncharacterized membrane protein
MNLKTSKIMGGIGAILILIDVLPFFNYFGPIIPFIGAIFILVALHGLDSYYKEEGIFKNALYGIGAGILGAILSIVVGVAIVLPNIKDFIIKVFPTWDGNWTSLGALSGITPNTSNISFGDIIPFVVAAISAIVILWVFTVIAAFFTRRSFKKLATKTSVGLFSTAGLLLLIGAFLTIIVIGVILMWIAVLLIAIAFFQIKPRQFSTANG